MKKNICYNKNIFIFLTALFLFIFPLNSKSKSTAPVVKYVHPRVYEFDLCDAKSKVFLRYYEESDCFESYIDFTKYVKDDMPKAGDQINFYFNGYCKKSAGEVYASILDDGYSIIGTNGVLFIPYIEPDKNFRGMVSFIVQKDVEKDFVLNLWSSMENIRGQIDQAYLHFERVVDSTDTSQELFEQNKALKNNSEIIEVSSEIVSAEVLAAQEAALAVEAVTHGTSTLSLEEQEAILAAQKAEAAEEEEARLEAERIAAEKLLAEKLEAERLEAARKEAERLAAEALALEIKKQEEELQKAIDSVKAVTRYEKEYLNDYMVYDTPELSDSVEIEEDIIEQPDEADSYGRTLLMKAAKAGNDWQIKTLLKSGANVNLKDKDGWTALMYAVRYQESMSCVNLLIDSGADVKVLNKYNSSALSIAACYNSNPEVLKKLLTSYSATDKEVHKALILLLSESRNSEYIQLAKLNEFIDFSVPLNFFYEGKTPLMYSAQFGSSTKVLKALIDNNAIVTIRSSEGKTAYDYAALNKNLKHDENYWALNKK